MNWAIVFGCGVIGFGFAFSFIPLILKGGEKVFPQRVDLHDSQKAPISRFGGLALLLAFLGNELVVALVFPESRSQLSGRGVLMVSSVAMFMLGFIDDLKPIGAKTKLLGQILIAVGVCYAGVGIQTFKVPVLDKIVDLQGWGLLVTVAWLVGMTNLINLVDGVDGLAGGISFMLMTLLVYVGHSNGSFVLLSSGMAGAVLAFLLYNFPPARIYLGDGGAYLLGFQIGMLSLLSSHKGAVFGALATPLFVLALPIVDTSLAILRRGLRGLPVFRPDQRHLHHRLLRLGHSRRRVVLSFYAVTLVFLAMGFAAYWSRGQLVPVLMGMAALVLLLFAGRLPFSREWFAVGRVVGNSLAMRQKVQYALSLIRWVELEGDRALSVAELFDDLTFAARKLGFTRVTLRLPDGERVWSAKGTIRTQRTVLFDLHSGCGTLELEAPESCQADASSSRKCSLKGVLNPEKCPCVADSRLFEILGELIAEGWLKGARRLQLQNPAPLSFGAPGSGESAASAAHPDSQSAKVFALSETSLEGGGGL